MDKNYVAAMVDPPWPESGGGKIKRGANRHYDLIRTKEGIRDRILAFPEWGAVAEDAHLYLWTTNNYLGWGLWLVAELGFVYKTNFPWVKPGRPGIGQYARGQHELLLFATRGRGFAVRSDDRTIRTDALVGVPRVVGVDGKPIHSAKPDAAYELVERRTVAGPRLDVFARRRYASHWDTCGDQSPGQLSDQDSDQDSDKDAIDCAEQE